MSSKAVKLDLTKELEALVERCENALFVDEPTQFVYPEECSMRRWPIKKIKEKNKKLLAGLNNNGNIYAIYIFKKNAAVWIPVYVGERKSDKLGSRISQHFIRKNNRTGSQVKNIRKVIASGGRVALSYIKVEPEAMRLSVEESIIRRKNSLVWNKHGKASMKYFKGNTHVDKSS